MSCSAKLNFHVLKSISNWKTESLRNSPYLIPYQLGGRRLIMKKWQIEHNGHTICVENSVTRERLYVDDSLQDESVGKIFGTTLLWGHLNGEGSSRFPVKVRLGGVFSIGCSVFVDDELVFSTHKQS